jgi:hypothetical protein
VICFRNADVDLPFFWESSEQPPARWHGPGEGPAQYLATTPDAAWAEFLRHQEITDPVDVAGIERAMWAVDLPEDEAPRAPELASDVLLGDQSTYRDCQREAARLRAAGATRLMASSAATNADTPSGWVTDGGLRPGHPVVESTVVLFGARPAVVGWQACAVGRPAPMLLARVRPFREAGASR